MSALDISPHLVANTYAKQILENSSQSEQEFYPSQEQTRNSGSKSTPTRDYGETSDETKDKRRPVKRNGLSSPEVKRLEQLYLKGPASYGSKKTLTYTEQAAIIQSEVLFGDKTVFHKVPFNSIKISQA